MNSMIIGIDRPKRNHFCRNGTLAKPLREVGELSKVIDKKWVEAVPAELTLVTIAPVKVVGPMNYQRFKIERKNVKQILHQVIDSYPTNNFMGPINYTCYQTKNVNNSQELVWIYGSQRYDFCGLLIPPYPYLKLNPESPIQDIQIDFGDDISIYEESHPRFQY